jgi:SAM-dependent methyltransferase
VGGGRAAGTRARRPVTSGVDRRRHWDRVFEERGPTGVSWHERLPRMSLEMIDLTGIGPDEAALDVGGGASPLAGALLAGGFADVTVLDLSEVALLASRARLGPVGARAHWVHADVLDWSPDRTYGLWHDRAVFHFLVDAEDRERYVMTALSALRPGGHAVVGTFAEDGPAICSGLPVARYDTQALADAFGAGFALVGSRRHEHRTPGGSLQSFTWVAMRRRSS